MMGGVTEKKSTQEEAGALLIAGQLHDETRTGRFIAYMAQQGDRIWHRWSDGRVTFTDLNPDGTRHGPVEAPAAPPGLKWLDVATRL
jgi:hypothetical protein